MKVVSRGSSLLVVMLLMAWGGPAQAGGAGVTGFAQEFWEQLESRLETLVTRFRDGKRPAEEEDDDGEKGQSEHRVLYQGRPALRLDDALQEISGIEVSPLGLLELSPELEADAQVIEIVPLLSLRTRYFTTAAEAEVFAVEIHRWQQEVSRLRQLRKEGGNVALRRLQQAESELRSNRVRHAAARHRLRGLRDEAVQVWGETITEWALAEDSALFRRLITREDRLLLLFLRPGVKLPDAAGTIFIGQKGGRLHARKAFRVSPAPRTDPRLQGESWYFRTPGESLRTGMRLHAWVPTGEAPVEGVWVPEEAVVWYGGRPWIFLRLEEDLFVRHSLAGARDLGDGWFVAGGLEPGQEVVTSGAQLLLSEEFNWQIPDEDEE